MKRLARVVRNALSEALLHVLDHSGVQVLKHGFIHKMQEVINEEVVSASNMSSFYLVCRRPGLSRGRGSQDCSNGEGMGRVVGSKSFVHASPLVENARVVDFTLFCRTAVACCSKIIFIILECVYPPLTLCLGQHMMA